MNYFITSDTHFNHHNIIEYTNRPFKHVDEMDRILIENWNSVVNWDDTVFHLGDFSFGNPDYYKSRLNGNITFIKGNHDDKKLTRIENIHFIFGMHTIFMTHDPALAFVSPSREILCGHVHGLFKEIKSKDKHIINVGVDVWDYTPVSIETIINMFNKK